MSKTNLFMYTFFYFFSSYIYASEKQNIPEEIKSIDPEITYQRYSKLAFKFDNDLEKIKESVSIRQKQLKSVDTENLFKSEILSLSKNQIIPEEITSIDPEITYQRYSKLAFKFDNDLEKIKESIRKNQHQLNKSNMEKFFKNDNIFSSIKNNEIEPTYLKSINKDESIENLAEQLFTLRMPEEDRLDLINYIKKEPENQQKDIIKQCLRITQHEFKFTDTRKGLIRIKSKALFKIVSTIANIPQEKRESTVTQSLKIITGWVSDINIPRIIDAINKIPLNEQKDTIDELLRFIPEETDKMTETGICLHSTIIQDITRVPFNQRHIFANFILNNTVTNLDHIHQLSQGAQIDWRYTLAQLRNVDTVQIRGFDNQTIHNKAVEESIKNSLTKLNKRYKKQMFEDYQTTKNLNNMEKLQKLADLYLDKSENLVKKKLLTQVQQRILVVFITKSLVGRLKENPDQILEYLNLVWFALNDKNIVLEMEDNVKAPSTDEEIDRRIASYFDAGPIDAQLAYWLDNIGGIYRGASYKTKQELLAAIENDPNLINLGQSCPGGQINRLITALNHIHKDVEIAAGEGTINNLNTLSSYKFLSKKVPELMKDIYEKEPDSFEDKLGLLEQIKKLSFKALIEKGIIENYELSENILTEHLEGYLKLNFENDIGKVLPFSPIYTYIEDLDKGLCKDLCAWVEKEKPSFRSLSKELKKQAESLVNKKITERSENAKVEIQKEEKDDIIDLAINTAEMFKKQTYSGLCVSYINLYKKDVKLSNKIQEMNESLKEIILKQLVKDKIIKEGDVENCQEDILQTIENEQNSQEEFMDAITKAFGN